MKTSLCIILSYFTTFSSCVAFSKISPSHPATISRERFLKKTFFFLPSICILTGTSSSSASAIEFVPASPSFNYSFNDAIDILSSQRLACDNIIDVISDGNLNEAAFKLMQLSSQTRVGGKIILDSFQNNNMSISSGSSSSSSSSNNSSSSNSSSSSNNSSRIQSQDKAINTIKFLKYQEKFVTLLDYCSECEIQIEKALKGKYGVTAPAQIKLLTAVNDLKNAFDDFLMEFLEDSSQTSL